jgi:crossover junction endonuclease MUS81
VDTREIKDAKSRDFIAAELRKKGINVERRSLELGDVAWVAKTIRTYDQNPTNVDTVVFDFVLERKRLDDLVASLTDGRFHEQKVDLFLIVLRILLTRTAPL